MRGRGSLHRSDDSCPSMKQAIWLFVTHAFIQDVFVIPDGAPGALAELERRKFTAEEGVRILEEFYLIPLNIHDSHIS